MTRRIPLLILVIVFGIGVPGNTQTKTTKKSGGVGKDTTAVKKPLITFIELGSVRCIPCKMMEPILKSLEERYGDQLKIVFYDVWTPKHEQFAYIYKVRALPTQVFLDADGNEIHRHEGYYPEKEIDAFLQSRGLKPKK